MNSKFRNTLILAAVGIITLFAGWQFGTPSQGGGQKAIAPGTLVFPGLAAKLQAAEKLTITTKGHTMTLVRKDGIWGIADRGGYRGVTEFLDVFDYHGGSSDVPVWSIDGQSVFYTAKVGNNVELFRVTLDGRAEQLTHSAEGTLHYHATPSPDGQWIVYGSKRSGVRNLFVMCLSDRKEHALTDVSVGHAAMHAFWQPHERGQESLFCSALGE